MKTAGIIAEYNPFHNGHQYHLERTKEITGADYIIVVLSGDFVQRGVPAITDKYSRTRMALEGGADLVLELPLYYAAGSAEYFAMGAVSLLDKLGVTDFLCFGSECGKLSLLQEAAASLVHEPDSYKSSLQSHLKKGVSFPKARQLALEEQYSVPDSILKVLSSPNNALGIEYIKALLRRGSSILPCTIERQGASYHDASLSPERELFYGGFPDSQPKSSASAIRCAIEAGKELAAVRTHVPPAVYEVLQGLYSKGFPVKSNDFSLLLRYKLLSEAENGFTCYVDVNDDISDKIRKNLNYFIDYEQFCAVLKSKNTTYSRISRCLLHILLDIKKSGFAACVNEDYISYARILGFRKTASGLLHAVKKNTVIPLLSKLADAPFLLTQTGAAMLEKDLMASHIYGSVVSAKFHVPFVNEYTREIVIV